MATPASPPESGAASASLSALQATSKATPEATPKGTSKATSKANGVATAEARSLLKSVSPEMLAQALAEQLAISPNDWHRLSANRAVRAREQAAAALVYMLKDKPEEALPRLAQAMGWLNKTLSAPPCPSHGSKRDRQ